MSIRGTAPFLVAGVLLLAGCGSDDTPTGGIVGVGPSCQVGESFSFNGGVSGATAKLFVTLQNFSSDAWRMAWVTDVMGARLVMVQPFGAPQSMEGGPQSPGGVAITLELPFDGGVPAQVGFGFVMHATLQIARSSVCTLAFPVIFSFVDGALVKVNQGPIQ